jgi:hypothetical protein
MFGTSVTPASTVTATTLAASACVGGELLLTVCAGVELGVEAFDALVPALLPAVPLPPPPPPPHATSSNAKTAESSNFRNESEIRMIAPLLNDTDVDAGGHCLRQIRVSGERTQMAAGEHHQIAVRYGQRRAKAVRRRGHVLIERGT